MYSLFSRISWILAIIAFFAFLGLGIEWLPLGVIAFMIIRYGFLSDEVIESYLAREWDKKKKTVPHKEEAIETQPISAPEPEKPKKEVDMFEDQESEEKPDPTSLLSDTTQEALWDGGMIQRFFRENILAKLWGVLVFLGVLFLMTLVYSIIGPMMKVIIGFVIGFIIYGVGVFLDKKWYKNESRILLGIGILVNYLVILGGRYVIGNTFEWPGYGILSWDAQGFLTVSVTFLLLILNTVFAVLTALFYQSRTLLVFSFLFAYANPLLLGTTSSDPYTLLGYTMIVTLGAMSISFLRHDDILFFLSLAFSIVLFLVAPYHDDIQWITKFLCIDAVGIMALYVSTQFEQKYQQISNTLVLWFFLLIGVMGMFRYASLSLLDLLLVSGSSMALMIFAYGNMHRGMYFYSIGTIGTIFTLFPMLTSVVSREDLLLASGGVIVLFALVNIGILFFKYVDLLASNIANVVGGVLAGGFFLGCMNYFFGNIYFPWVTQGFVFFLIASVYFCMTFFFVSKIGIETMKHEMKYRDIFFIFSAIGVGFFTLSIAFLFSHSPMIIALLWLIEANILFFLAQRIISIKTTFLGLVLLAIWVSRIISSLVGYFSLSEMWTDTLIALLSFISLLLNVVILFGRSYPASFPKVYHVFHALIHVVWVLAMVYLIDRIFHLSWNEWNFLIYLAGALCGLGIFYRFFEASMLRMVTNIFSVFVMVMHLNYSMFFGMVSIPKSLITVGLFTLLWIYVFVRERKITEKILFAIFVVYVFAVTSVHVFDIFSTTFAVTMYWGVLAFVTLWYGIKNDVLPLRTLWLYFIILMVIKIFLYDIMMVDDTIARVIVFIGVGILMILLSVMYTRKYGNTLNQEFSPINLFRQKKNTEENSMKKEMMTDM